jgi:ABC-type branched-subunit amino acid transport system substrate-binding protein
VTSFRGILLLLLTASLFAQNRLTPQEERGRRIFERGDSASGQPITASLNGEDHVAASILPCSNCHGHDGQGKPEGGVVPSNITWDALTKPYGVTHPDGRSHPPYTERLLKRAITMGVDPAGHALNNAMPRFQLSLADASDLVAYIKRLGQAVDPGLTADAVGLGVILPASANASTSQIVRRVLLDYFARVNGAGGVFGRRIEVTFTELPLNPAQQAGTVRDFLGREQIFAVVCGSLTGAEAEIAAVLRDTGTPAMATFAAFPQTASPLNPYVFYLDGGIPEEADALIDFALKEFPGPSFHPAIVASDDGVSRQAAAWLRTRLAKSSIVEAPLPSANAVFWLRPDSPRSSDRQTMFLIPGSLLGASSPLLPPGANTQVFVAQGAASPAADRARASAELMIEGLKRAGRNLTRATLLEALEGFHRVETGLHAPVSFGPNRRVGSSDVRVTPRQP